MTNKIGKLTVREEKIIALVAAGMKNMEIAAALGTTEGMVKNWMRTIYDKTGFGNRVQLSLWYVRYREKAQAAEGIDYEI